MFARSARSIARDVAKRVVNANELARNARNKGRSRLGEALAGDARLAARGYANDESMTMEAQGKARKKANVEFAKVLFALAIGTVGATYASVPLYRVFCRATGFGGTTRRATIDEKVASEGWSAGKLDEAAQRELLITFNADVAEGMPWKFTPTQKSIKVVPGESALAFYTARNLSSQPITGVATYNVQPNKVGVYFNKVQCFCFEEQRLRGKEEVDMPVLFYIDPEFATDPNMADVKRVVLSYTFFKSDDFEDEKYDEQKDLVATSHARTHARAVPPSSARASAAAT